MIQDGESRQSPVLPPAHVFGIFRRLEKPPPRQKAGVGENMARWQAGKQRACGRGAQNSSCSRGGQIACAVSPPRRNRRHPG